MTFDDILDKMRAPNFFPKYPSSDSIKSLPHDFIFDENQSVKWNRQKVQERNEVAQQAKKLYRDRMNEIDRWFSKQVQEVIQNELQVSEKAASIIFNQAWEEGHSTGYQEVVHYAEQYCEFIQQILNTMKED